MKLDGHGILSAVEVAFFAPSFIIAAILCIRHGFNTKYGWFYLLTLSLLRLIGASVILYAETQNDNSTGLLITAAITSSIGTAPLLLALMGFQERINTSMSAGRGVGMAAFRPIHLVSLAALIISIVGGTYASDSSASSRHTGKQLMETGAILLLVVYLALAGITLLSVTRQSYVPREEIRLLRATVVALPFLLVRIVYSQVTVFAPENSKLYYRNPDVWVQAFMQFLMEAITVTIFIIAGAMTPKILKLDSAVGEQMAKDVEGQRGPGEQRVPRQQPQQQRPQRSLGDYRPSRLVMNAISNRR